MHIKSKEAVANLTVECMTSGASTPATRPLALEPTKACSDDAMPRRSGYKSSTSSVTTGTINAQPKANRAIGNKAHDTCAGKSRLANKLRLDTLSMMTKPWRICFLGAIFPASRPLSQAPDMMPLMVNMNNQKNSVGSRCRCSLKKVGADITYKNMPLNGTPLASASSKKRGLEPSCQ